MNISVKREPDVSVLAQLGHLWQFLPSVEVCSFELRINAPWD